MPWYEWAFSGIGATILGGVGFLLRRSFLKSQAATPSVSANLHSVSDSNVAIGNNVSQHNISVQHPVPDTRPKIVFRATRFPSAKWPKLEGTPPEVFTLTHIGGDAARFIKINPIQSARGNNVWVSFDEIDLLDSATREVHPNFTLVIAGERRFAGRAGNLYYVFFGRDAALLKKQTVDYLVTITFRWNKKSIEDRVILTCNNATRTLTTAPID